MKKDLKNKTGITLIALIVTIVVLIILVGITLNLIMGENGVVKKAEESKREAEITSILEKLELEKANLGVDTNYYITIDQYLEYIKNKGIIQETDIEDVGEINVKYITVDEKYIFYIKDEENGNVKIDRYGILGEVKPKILSLVLNSTTNSITAQIQTKLDYEGTYKYYIRKSEEGDYIEKASLNTKDYIYEGLEQKVKYDIKVEIVTKTGEKASIEKSIITQSVEGLITANTTFTYSPNDWTNGNIIATVTTEVKGYTLQTSKDGIDWKTQNSQTFTSNGTIYARVVDSTNQATGYVTGNVDKIDKEAPKSEVTFTSSTSSESAVIKAMVTNSDNLSKIKTSSCKWVYNTISTQIGTQESSYTGGTFTSNTEEVTLTAINEETYYLHILTVDNAGNRKETISSKIQILKEVHTHIGNSTTEGGCYTTAVYTQVPVYGNCPGTYHYLR